MVLTTVVFVLNDFAGLRYFLSSPMCAVYIIMSFSCFVSPVHVGCFVASVMLCVFVGAGVGVVVVVIVHFFLMCVDSLHSTLVAEVEISSTWWWW